MSDFVRLGEHITIAKGKPAAQLPFDGPGSFAYLTPEYLRGRASATAAKPGRDAVAVADGDAVLLWDGSNAGEFFHGKAGLAASTMARLRADTSLDPGYFVHALKHLEPRLKSQTSGTGIPHVDRGVLEDFMLFRPALREQVQIAQILDTLDTTIRQTEAIIAKLKQVKQGLLHDLLTRGIDANGELRPPQSQAPHLYKDSPLGWVPLQWQVDSLEAIADLQVGFAFKSEWFRDTGTVRLLRGDNVGYGAPDWAAAKFLDEKLVARFSEYLLGEGDVVVGMDRTFTKSGAKFSEINLADLPGLLVQRVGRFVATGCSTPFLKVLTRWPNFQMRLASQEKGMDIPHLSKTEILEPIVPIPPADEQVQIVNRCLALEARLLAELRSAEKLKQLKSGLMDDLLTGRVRVTPLLDAAARA